jgi:hypothetical protein
MFYVCCPQLPPWRQALTGVPGGHGLTDHQPVPPAAGVSECSSAQTVADLRHRMVAHSVSGPGAFELAASDLGRASDDSLLLLKC